MRYIQVVKRAGVKVDKLEQMLGSYAPQADAYTKNFDPEESPSGMLARSGTYGVRSRVIDDDGEIFAGAHAPASRGYADSPIDFEWTFKLTKEW